MAFKKEAFIEELKSMSVLELKELDRKSVV